METEKNILPTVSDSEWKVMNLLWQQSPQTSHQIIEGLGHTHWSPKTIKTLIHRLEKKGLISHREGRREFHYYPVFEKSLFLERESRSLKKKIFGSTRGSLVAHFLKNEEISQLEMQEIKRIMESLEKKGGLR